jgi:hypothetical protein
MMKNTVVVRKFVDASVWEQFGESSAETIRCDDPMHPLAIFFVRW